MAGCFLSFQFHRNCRWTLDGAEPNCVWCRIGRDSSPSQGVDFTDRRNQYGMGALSEGFGFYEAFSRG
jgi:hypothetical protein